MEIHGDQVWLTAADRHQLETLTKSSTRHIRNRKQLTDFVEAHLVSFPGRSAEEKLLRGLLERFHPDEFERRSQRPSC